MLAIHASKHQYGCMLDYLVSSQAMVTLMNNYMLQNLVNGDKWALAVENAIGKLLNAFIVTNHKDSLLLRACAREAKYFHLRIIIYDFSRPR